MKRTKSWVALILLLASLLGLGYIAWFGIGKTKDGSVHSINLGLDLAGGVSITYQVVGDKNPSAEDMSDTVYKLQQRVGQYSTEAQVYKEGSNRISIEIPGVNDADKILTELGQPGNLYFIAQTNSKGEENYTSQGGEYKLTKNIAALDMEGSVVMKGTDVKTAQAGAQTDSSTGAKEYMVDLQLTDAGRKKFAKATKRAFEKGETIAIYYDGKFVSVPKVNSEIKNGRAQITGAFTVEEAQNLASTIRIGGLSLQLKELRSNVVGAQLGVEAIHSSLIAALVGFAMVVLFMLLVYRILGLAADIALAFYCCLVVILLDGLEITLTLPGIAGIILSIGMAVDANVLVFARIREEMQAGKSVKEAMKSGYHAALSAILDGNITTLIAAVVLMIFGTGSIRGFAYTLTLGTVVSLFSALLITRAVSACLYGIGLQGEKLYGKPEQIKYLSIIKNRKIYYAVSLGIMAVGVIVMLFNTASGKGPMNFSLDFVGGTSTTVTFNENHTLQDLDANVVPAIRKATGVSSVQTQTVSGTKEVIFKTIPLSVEQRKAMSTALQDQFKVPEDKIAAETISATISDEMSRDAILSVLIALVCILFYVRIRFSDMQFGIAAIIALAHDAVIVTLCYVVTRIEVGNTFIASVLTIVGYSINDTIVTFDRIRENKARGKLNKEELINTSVTQTMSRSLFTSLTTFLMVLSLFIFGVTDIRNFALPLMVGIICGTYSSIFIASPLWYDMTKKDKKLHV